ncbi:Ig-like domain-containing protein [Pseudaeromonas paramecii]|uniref:Dystroglycan-type cadherin-like domain-containing protein n=1 Tax=Pseudaeromonas paramecii TaxID=2138166 RepID=A0ABP8QIZ4_9GAMM
MSRAWLWLGLLVAFTGSAKELVLVDAELAGQIPTAPGMELRRLHGLDDLPGALAGERWSRVSLISHGQPGALQLGTERLDQAFLAAHPDFLTAWRHQLTADAQLELWGCAVAKEQGHQLVDSLSTAIGHPVLASTDATGPADLGGNLTLEYGQGRTPDSAPVAQLQQLLTLSSSDSQNFESIADGTLYDSPATIGSFTFYSNSTGMSAGQKMQVASYFTHVDNVGLYVASSTVGDVTQVRIVGASTFKLSSIWLGAGAGDGDIILHAYLNDAEIGTGRSVSLSDSSIDTSSFSEFENINELRITGTDLDLLVDNIMVDAPVVPDSDGSLTAGGGSEPTSIATTAGATAALDFTLADGGTSDGLAMTVSQVQVHVSGTSTTTERSNVVWTLSGPDISGSVTGSYNSGVVTFSGLAISIADGGSETYTVNANLGHSGLTEGHTFILSLDGDTDLTLGSTSTQMASTTAVTNGAGFTTSVTASQLAFTTQPAGSISGSALTTQPVVAAQDSYGNTDLDFTSNVSLSEASAGSLSGTSTVAASSGVASFSGLAYTASADQEAFTLTAAASGLTGATANSITADVVATKLLFTTQPAPTSLSSGSTTYFSTVPVVRAVDANNTVDTGYSTSLLLSVTDTSGAVVPGTVNSLTGTGDGDGSGTTVTLTPTSGSATFTALALNYTNAGVSDSLALRATSGSLSAALSSTLTSVALPTVTDANISLAGASGTGGAYKIGDTVTVTWNNTSSGDNNSGITGVTVDFSQFGGGTSVTASNSSETWTATYTLTAGSLDATSRNVSVSATNANGTSTTADSSNATVDNQAPTVSDAQISLAGASGTGGTFKIGDTVTVTWNNTSGGDNNGDISSVKVDFSAFGGGSAVTASNSSGIWTATYTLTAGNLDISNANVSVTATDDAGNSTTTADTSNATLDNQAPTVTDAHISIAGASGSGGTFKVGDTVTATWDDTAGGDNNSDTLASVTVDFSAFGGGSSVAASNSSGSWTASYTLVAGSLDATNRNVSVTATDNAGNGTTVSDTSNAGVDNQAPTVTDANIGLSGASGTGGAFKIGDTVTATWNNTGSGDNNGDISSVAVDFSAFGGGSSVAASNSGDTWTATYTLTAGSLEGSNLNLTLTATDDAGNSTTTADTSNATVDNLAPAAPSTPGLDTSSDSGSQGDGITNDTTPTLTGTGEANASLVVLDGATQVGNTTVDGGGSWSLTTSALSEGSHSLTAQQTDGAGNTSSASAALSLTLDATAPSGYSLTLDQTAINAANQGATSVTLSGAEVGSQYQLTVSSSGGGSPVTSSGTITTASQQLTGLNVSGLADGTLTYSLTLTDDAANAGSAATDTAVKDGTAPTGYSAGFVASYVNLANQTSQSVTLSGGQSGDSYQLTIGDGTNSVSRSGTLAGSSLTLTALDLSSLAEGSLNLSLVLTDSAGNAGTAATASITKDTVAPTLQSSTPAANATDVALSTSISLTFSEDMATGSGTDDHLSLTASDSSLLFDGAANGGAVTVSGATVGFTPSQELVPTLVHSLAVGSEALTDLAGNPFAGTSLSFTAMSAAPVAVNDSFNLTEDVPAQLAVLSNDTLVRGSFNNASLVVISQAQHGSLTLNTATGILTYSPVADYNGSDSFSYQVQDSYGTVSNSATVSLTLAAVNDAPRAQDDSASLQAGDSLTLDVLANDGEVDTGDSLDTDSLVLVSQPARGSASVQNGQIHYQAAADYTGVVTITYQVADSSQGALSNEATLTLTILAANAPVANVDSASLDEDNSLDIDVLANDSGNSLDADSLVVVQAPQHGSASPVNGQLRYVPTTNYVGSDSLSYRVNDATGQTSNVATVSLTINPVNDAPVAVADTSVLTGVGVMDINVKGNDSDVDNDNADLTIVLVSQPAQGTATVVNGLVRYTPVSTISSDDSFSYRLVDPSGASSAPASVSIVLSLPNQAPLAVDDSVSTSQNQAVTIAVLANDSDSDGNLDSGSLSLVSAPSHGTVSLAGGQITYTPATDYHGDDSFSYQVADDAGAQSNSATVSVRVLLVNQAPVAVDDSLQVIAGQTSTLQVLANDSDSDGSLVSVELRQLPAHGSAAVQADGSISYTAASDYQGSDSFSYVAVDDQGGQSDEATVTLTVQPANTAPQIGGTPSGSVQQGANYRFAPSASDSDGDSLTFSIQNLPAWASFDPATGVLSGVPGNDAVGTSSNIVISVSDGAASRSLPAFSITVVNVNDAPLAQADSYSLAEAGQLTTSASNGLLANDSDPDGDALSAQLLTSPAHASTFSLNSDGSFSYQHDGSEASSDSFSYQISDAQGGVASGTVSLVIRPVNDAPIFTSTAPTAAVAGATFSYQVVVDDPDSAVTLSLVESPSWLSLEDNLLTGTVPADASGDVTVALEASDGSQTASQRFALTLTEPQQSLVALAGGWQGLPAKVGKPLALVLTAQLQAGPALSDAVLELSLQGADMTTMSGCTLNEGVQRCPVSLAVSGQQQFTLPINTQNQGDQTVVARVLDSDGNLLSELTTDVTLATEALSQGDRAAIVAKATALAIIHDQDQPLLVVGTAEGEGLSLYRFSGNSLVAEASLDNLGHTRALATLDWNQDGLEDLVVINSSGDASALYLNQGDLHFSALQTLPFGRKIKVAELDGDSYPDLLIGGQGLYLLRGNQGGSQAGLEVVQTPFTVSEFALWPDGRALITDGSQLSLIALDTVADQSTLAATRLTRSATADDSLTVGSIRTLQVADLDGDGQTEAVASYGLDDDGQGGGVSVLTEASDGSLSTLTHIGDAAVNDLLVADFDGDADLDLLAQHDNGSWQLLTNQGTASSFIASNQTLFHPDSLGLVGDFNGDGLADILLTDVGDGALTIYNGITSLLLGPSADLALSSHLSRTSSVYQTHYQLTVHNQGQTDVDQVRLTIQLPASLTVAQWPETCIESQVGWQCDLGSLASGDQVVLSLALDNASLAKASVSARVDGSASDPDTSNNSTTTTWNRSGGGALSWPWLLLLPLAWSRRKARRAA